jgi:hypothetical protein
VSCLSDASVILAAMETILITLLAVACLLYLAAAVLRPEKF